MARAVGSALALALPPCALATTITVINNNDSGNGSLRQAVIDANADAPGAIINFQAGLASLITLTTGAIAITNAMSIEGPGANTLTVSGNNASRIFTMKNSTSVAMAVGIDGLTLSGGYAGNKRGGAIYAQGANLTVSHSVLTGNTTGTVTGGTNHGGAIFASNYNSQGTLDIEYSTLSGNTTTAYGGAVYGTNLLQATINQSTLTNNTAGGSGGGMFLTSGPISLTHSTISSNQSGAFGGGATLKNKTGTFAVSNCVFTGNHAVTGGGVYFYNGAPTIINTTISGNTVSGSGGGIYAEKTNLTVSSSTITGNTSAGTVTNTGGGLYALNAALNIEQSLISGNTAHTGGGLTVNNPVYGSASGLVIQYSTISQNTATSGRGGGINLSYDTNFAATLTNDTIVGNSSFSGFPYGGGIFSNAGNGGTGTLTIQSSTIVNNSAGRGGGIYDNPIAAAIVVHNTIVANNSASATGPDLNGSFLANYNFIRNTTGATLTPGSANNLTGADPQLGSLDYYGGPTPTKLPLSTSPVIDAGDPASTALGTDQRGYTRVVNGRIDIGADERQTSEDTIFLDGFEDF